MKTPRSLRFLASSATLLAALALGQSATQASPHPKISVAQANAIVKKRFPGHLTAKTSLENEDASWQYSVMVRSGKVLREVMVDANTGKIADVEVTTDAKEKSEARQEASEKAKASTPKTSSPEASTPKASSAPQHEKDDEKTEKDDDDAGEAKG